jgi:hypothetical protein
MIGHKYKPVLEVLSKSTHMVLLITVQRISCICKNIDGPKV